MKGRLSDEVYQLLLIQVANEMRNASVYLSMSNNMEVVGYKNSAKYFLSQHGEEMNHVRKIVAYMTERNAPISLTDIEGVGEEQYTSPIEAFVDSQELEFMTTTEWNIIYEMCIEKKDWITLELAREFMNIQEVGEEEIMGINDQLKLLGDNPISPVKVIVF